MAREGAVVHVTVTIGRKSVEVPCTLVEDHGRQGWVVEYDELVSRIEDVAGEQLAREELDHAAE